jgi:hypothetical protein
MSRNDKLVAVVSPWEKLPALVQTSFRIESLPTEKMVMVWRDDLQSEQALADALRQVGVKSFEIRMKCTTDWKALD